MMLAREARREPSPDRADELLAHLIQAGDELNLQIAAWLGAPAARPALGDDSPTPPRAGGNGPRSAGSGVNDVGTCSTGESGRTNAAAGPDGGSVAAAGQPSARRVLLIDANAETRDALQRGLAEIGCSVTGVASARAAIGELISLGDRMPDRIIVNSRSRGDPLQQTLLGIGHVLQARVPIVVLSGDMLAGAGQEPDREWRSLGVVTVVPRPRSLDALRRLLVS
jgi:CheY-like chemotaxis protein